MFEAPNTTTSDIQSDSEVEGLFVALLDGLVGIPAEDVNCQVGELELRRRALDAETAAAVHVAE
ncbi:MAG TPA: hypothetical protein VMM60_00670, partial [Ilumatobacter sp.]|nr:hypothetical protein [Ilumatobacter sp.]